MSVYRHNRSFSNVGLHLKEAKATSLAQTKTEVIYERKRGSHFLWRGPKFNATHVHGLMDTSTTSSWARLLSLRSSNESCLWLLTCGRAFFLGVQLLQTCIIAAAYGPENLMHTQCPYPDQIMLLFAIFFQMPVLDPLPPLPFLRKTFHLSFLNSNILYIHSNRLLLQSMYWSFFRSTWNPT